MSSKFPLCLDSAYLSGLASSSLLLALHSLPTLAPSAPQSQDCQRDTPTPHNPAGCKPAEHNWLPAWDVH